MKHLFLLLAMLAFGAPAMAKEDPVQSTLRAQQFNSAAGQYMDRPTAVTVRGKPGKQELLIRFQPYGATASAFGGPLAIFRVTNADEYQAHIAKYLEWAEKAAANGDAFTKEIGKGKSVPGISLKFDFHSANASTHFLVISVCSLGNCSVSESMYFDVRSANELQALIVKLKSGALPGEDVAAKYN